MYEPLMSLGHLFNACWATIRANKKSFIELVLATLGLSLLVFGFNIFTQLTAKESALTIVLAVILIIPYLIASTVFNLATLEVTQAGLGNKIMILRDALANALHKLISAIGISLLQVLISMAITVPFGLLIVISSAISNATNKSSSMASTVLMVLAIVAMIPVMILIGIKIKFATASLVADGTKAAQSIKASWRMTEGQLWSICWRMIVFSVATVAPLTIVNMVLLGLGGIHSFSLANNAPLSLFQSLWSAIINGLTLAVGMVAQAAFTMVIWQDLKRVKSTNKTPISS